MNEHPEIVALLSQLQELEGEDDPRWLPTWYRLLQQVETEKRHGEDPELVEQAVSTRWKKTFPRIPEPDLD